MNRTLIAWTAALICLIAAWLALAALHFGPGASAISTRLLLSGIAFTVVASYISRRWGAPALAAFFVVAVFGLAALHGGAFAEAMDLVEYRRGVLAGVLLFAPSLGAVAFTMHRLARPASPVQRWDLPIGLVAFAIAQVVAVAIALGVALLVIPTVRS